jgi:aminopeptidase-like protein
MSDSPDPVGTLIDLSGDGASKERMREMIDLLYPLDRDLVSDGYDRAVEIIGRYLPTQLHRYPSGSQVWSWKVPEKWELRRGRIETLDGRIVVDSDEHSLHVARYSAPVNAIVSRDELLEHVFVHPVLAEAIPYIFFFYRENWGFCLTHEQRAALSENEYRVVIEAVRGPGTMTVAEVVVPGTSQQSMLLVAHIDHPWQVNDDLTGTVVGVEAFRRLFASGLQPKYTWRLLLLPETIGSVAWLSERQDLFGSIHGGVFLEMLGRPYPHRLQRSFSASSHVDIVFETTLAAFDPASSVHPFRTVIGNDERQFNAPGVRIPCLSLSRVRSPVLEISAHTDGSPAWPFDEYHSHLDDPAHCDYDALCQSADLVSLFMRHMEEDAIVENLYQGEIFLSRYGIDRELEVSWYRDPVFYKVFFDIMDRIDGTRTVSSIAREIGTDFATVLRVVQTFESQGLARRCPNVPAREGT